MNSGNNNPYAAPMSPVPPRQPVGLDIQMEPKDRRKAEAIIKDAGQFWLACILCIFCALLCSVIVPIWYTVRLMQWTSLSKKYPELVSGIPVRGSIRAKFKSAQWKLITGLVFGCCVFLLIFGVFALGLVVDPPPPRN